MPRRKSSLVHEAERAMLSLAGWNIIIQDTVSAGAGANTAHTIESPNCRRVAFLYLSGTTGDIRFNVDAAATASHAPVMVDTWMVVDAAASVQFWNTTGGGLTVYILELE